MAQITITIPDGIAARVNNGVAGFHNYQDRIPDPNTPGQTIDNPETKVQFSKRKIKEILKLWVVAYEASVGRDAAEASAISDINIGD